MALLARRLLPLKAFSATFLLLVRADAKERCLS